VSCLMSSSSRAPPGICLLRLTLLLQGGLLVLVRHLQGQQCCSVSSNLTQAIPHAMHARLAGVPMMGQLTGQAAGAS